MLDYNKIHDLHLKYKTCALVSALARGGVDALGALARERMGVGAWACWSVLA
jgi:hypothetical protein